MEEVKSAAVGAVAEHEFWMKTAARLDRDIGVLPAASERGFKQRVRFEALRQIAHRRPRRTATKHVARLTMALAGLAEFAPACHEAVSAAAGGSDTPVTRWIERRPPKACVKSVSFVGIRRKAC